MRDLIHALKYSGLRPAARQLGSFLAHAVAPLAAETRAGLVVVPVPLYRIRHAERGFNQARLLAAETVAVLRKQVPDWQLILAPGVLLRSRATESQAGLTTRQRRLNMRGAFAVPNPAAVAGKQILLVDDILTTGATARAASRALLQAGAASVWVATLARARRVDHAFDRSSVSWQETANSPASVAAEAQPAHAAMNSQNQPSF
ncbi:MAG TPA: ComF family protein [Terracidiphilus sp.]|jgi:ComF family protein|nr:ComF family protein [Terracidiphilus sp.]